ncbi:MAG: hypothetical protein Q8920_01730 [Bacillota bacterium]|nr:hypothetical protein [Bacillota bacterium]
MKKFIIVIFVVICILYVPIPVMAASGITLDGNFSDWADKPSLSDPKGDESSFMDMVNMKWYPDSSAGNLYLYCERQQGSGNNTKGNSKEKDLKYDDLYKDIIGNFNSNSYKYTYWLFSANFKTDSGNRTAYVFYHPYTRWVIVLLLNEKGQYLWSTGGLWGDDENTANRVGFYIPLSQLASSTKSGYQVELYYQSGRDRAPDSGYITISTISTFPVFTASVSVLIVLSGFISVMSVGKRKRRGEPE